MLQKKSVELAMEMIRTNPDQPRKYFSPDELEELTDSIREYGVLQPIIVKREKDGKFLFIAGERRFRAAKFAGLSRIPALVKDFDEKDLALISVVENVQRENLSFIEEAYAYKKLIDEFNLTQNELSLKIGKKQSTISNKLRILSLPQNIQEKLVNNQLSERHARALLKLEDNILREKVLDRVIINNLNVKQTEKLVSDVLIEKDRQRRESNRIKHISYKIYMNTIRGAFKQVKKMEKNAKFIESDAGDFVEVKIIIPKNEGCFT